jgi:riboflavin kinase / FMN adenylyltransferase
MTRERFATEFLADSLRAEAVFVGEDFRFGQGRTGDIATLRACGAEHGYQVHTVLPVVDARGPISSTRVREAVAAGRLRDARGLLGRDHALTGVVIAGDKRGRTLGFPTANLATPRELLPALGVYAVTVAIVRAPSSANLGAARAAPALASGVANLGRRPTLKNAVSPVTCEVHLFDFDEDIYGATLVVSLVQFLRAEQAFASLAELKAQIHHDAMIARKILDDE